MLLNDEEKNINMNLELQKLELKKISS